MKEQTILWTVKGGWEFSRQEVMVMVDPYISELVVGFVRGEFVVVQMYNEEYGYQVFHLHSGLSMGGLMPRSWAIQYCAGLANVCEHGDVYRDEQGNWNATKKFQNNGMAIRDGRREVTPDIEIEVEVE